MEGKPIFIVYEDISLLDRVNWVFKGVLKIQLRSGV